MRAPRDVSRRWFFTKSIMIGHALKSAPHLIPKLILQISAQNICGKRKHRRNETAG